MKSDVLCISFEYIGFKSYFLYLISDFIFRDPAPGSRGLQLPGVADCFSNRRTDIFSGAVMVQYRTAVHPYKRANVQCVCHPVTVRSPPMSGSARSATVGLGATGRQVRNLTAM